MKFSDLKVSTRQLIGFGAMFAIVLVASAISWQATRDAARHYEEERESLEGAVALSTASTAIWELRFGIANFMSGDAAMRARILEDEAKWRGMINGALTRYQGMHLAAEETAAMRDVQEAWKKYFDSRPKWFELYGAGKLDEAKEWRAANTNRYGAATVKGFANLLDAQRKAAADLQARAAAETASTRALVAGFVAFAALLALGIGFSITRTLQRQFGGEPADAARIAERIAAGDLTVPVEVKSGDETSLLASMRRMQEGLRQVMGQLSHGADGLNAAAQSLAATSSQVSASSQQQSGATQSVAASVQEMTVSIDQVTQHSGDALKLSRDAGELSQQCNQAVQSTAEEMTEIAQSAQELKDVIQALGQQSTRISTIVSVIQEITNQTNLLALNAAIEAARAGEQGRGFSVVADEVRKLAERTSSSTHEISQMIVEIQGGTARAVQHMEKWSGKVAEGVDRAKGAGAYVERIRGDAGRVVQAVTEISNALAEQASASTQIAQNVEKIAQMGEENNSAMSAMAGSAKHLDRLAKDLATIVGRFRLSGAPA